MKLNKLAGATSEILQIFIRDSSSTTGGGLTGLAYNTASLTAYYHRDTDTTATAISLVTMTVGTFTSSGFKEIDATNMPGWYQFCPPNAALASGAKSCSFHLKGATNMAPLPVELQLTAVNPDSATSFITAVNGVAQTGDSYGYVTSALTESYRANGATGTLAQILYELLGNIAEQNNSGTTRTVKKLDHSTTAATYTYDSSTPSTITRAT